MSFQGQKAHGSSAYIDNRNQLVQKEACLRITQLRTNGKFKDKKYAKGCNHTLIVDLLKKV